MALQNTARAKQQSRNTLIIVVVVVLLVLGAAAFLLLGGKAEPEAKAQKAQRPAGAIAVPVLSKAVKMGDRIGSNMLRITYYKPVEVPADALLSPKEFLGRRAARNLEVANYLTEDDLAAKGAHSGFSGIAKKGMRIVAVPEVSFPGYNALSQGDRVDLLSIGTPSYNTNPQQNRRGRASAVEKAVGGFGPGQSGGDALSRLNNRRGAPNASNNADPDPTSATLIAENAEVVSKMRGLIIFQMEPQDAHITTLALASGANIRAVFRPFNDDTRLTPTPDVKVTTRLPRPSLDPDTITVFNGTDRAKERAVSNLYRYDGDNSERFSPNAEDEENAVEPLIQNIN